MSEARYEALVRIGTGGMATVFVARARGALGFQRLVALKRAHPHVRDDAELAASLRLEATLAGRFRHPNVVAVLDVQEPSGEIELVLDYIEGVTLAELLHACEGERHCPEMTRVVLDVAAGLDAAHHATGDDGAPLGIVHRDVTPSNMLVGTDGITRISDFGIAHALEREGAHTATGVLKGKVGYMAPEYVERSRADAASDQFSLAIVAWEALTGKRLFKGPTELETLKRVVVTKVPKLAETDARLAPLDAALARALARSPEDRHASVADFASALEDAARGASLVASHAKVAELVNRVAHTTLEERRRRISGTGETTAEPVRSARDLVQTASIVAPRASVPAPPAPPEPPSPPSPTGTVSSSADVAPTRKRGPALLVGAAGLVVLAVAIGVATRGAREPEAQEALPSATPHELDADAYVAPNRVDTIELADDGPTTQDAGKRVRTVRHGTPTLLPTKAPPNPYKPTK